jgi:hypothetical protein
LRSELAALAAGDVTGRRRIMEQLTQIEGDRGVAARQRDGAPRVLHPEVQAISLGTGHAILGLPGEFFAETAQKLRADAALEHLMIACYTNHHVFYVVPHHAFDEGGYEPGVAVLDRSAEATFREASLKLLREVAG